MAHAVEEVEELVSISGALVINIGTLSKPWIEAMFKAGLHAKAKGVPVVLDPVGAGASRLRTDTARELVQQVRSGAGPRLLHAITYRVKGHVSVDLVAYRNAAELQEALQTDPIARARAQYLALPGTAAHELDRIEQAATDEVAGALLVAEAAPWPDPASAFTDVQNLGAGQWR